MSKSCVDERCFRNKFKLCMSPRDVGWYISMLSNYARALNPFKPEHSLVCTPLPVGTITGFCNITPEGLR